mgnify:CR=1 FL=1
MKSTSFFTAHSMKRRSFSVTDGRSIFIPGTLTLLRDRSVPPRTNSHVSSSSVLSVTRSSSSPSAINNRAPTAISRTTVATLK